MLRLIPIHLHAVATTPAGPMETYSLVPSHRLRPSPNLRRVGSCVALFEACAAFTYLRPTDSPSRLSDPLHQRLQQSRCLHCCSDCYRVERTSSRVGVSPTVDQRLPRRTERFGLKPVLPRTAETARTESAATTRSRPASHPCGNSIFSFLNCVGFYGNG